MKMSYLNGEKNFRIISKNNSRNVVENSMNLTKRKRNVKKPKLCNLQRNGQSKRREPKKNSLKTERIGVTLTLKIFQRSLQICQKHSKIKELFEVQTNQLKSKLNRLALIINLSLLQETKENLNLKQQISLVNHNNQPLQLPYLEHNHKHNHKLSHLL